MMMSNSLQKKGLFFIVISILTFSFSSFSKTPIDSSFTTLSLKKAVDKKYVSVIISGIYRPDFFQDLIDNDGMHFGKCMGIEIQSKSEKPFKLELKAGTELIPDDSTFQTMIVTKTVYFPIEKGSNYGAKFYAMCGEIHDKPPHINSLYSVGYFADKNVVKLANYLDEKYIQNMLGQHTLWAYTDGATFSELAKYGADSISIGMCAEILNAVGIETSINKKSNEKIEKVEKAENQTNSLNYYLGAISIFFFSTTILLFLKRKKSSIQDTDEIYKH